MISRAAVEAERNVGRYLLRSGQPNEIAIGLIAPPITERKIRLRERINFNTTNFKAAFNFVRQSWNHPDPQKSLLLPADPEITEATERRFDSSGRIKLPYGDIAPTLGDNPFYQMRFGGWDNLHHRRGAILSGLLKLAIDSVKNSRYLFNTAPEAIPIIPNIAHEAHLKHGHVPIEAMSVYDIGKSMKDESERIEWYAEMYPFLRKELLTVWHNEKDWKAKTDQSLSRQVYHHRIAPDDELILAKYGTKDADSNFEDTLEGGWDESRRGHGELENYLNPDLNGYLARNIELMAKMAQKLRLEEDVAMWQKKYTLIKQQMNELMWNEKAGVYLDYQYLAKEQQEDLLTLAGVIPLLAGIPPTDRAIKIANSLSKFLGKYGYADTALESELGPISKEEEAYLNTLSKTTRLAHMNKRNKVYQWNWPNSHIWVVAEVAEGLRRYAEDPTIDLQIRRFFRTKVRDLSELVINTLVNFYVNNGAFPEVIDVTNGKLGNNGYYKPNLGFGATNGGFIELCFEVDDIYMQENREHADGIYDQYNGTEFIDESIPYAHFNGNGTHPLRRLND